MSKESLYRQQGRHAEFVAMMVQRFDPGPERDKAIAAYIMTDEDRTKLAEMLAAIDKRRHVRRARRAAEEMRKSIDAANADPTWDRLLAVRVGGNDTFSFLTLPELQQQVGYKGAIEASKLSDRDKAAAYRWVARGLSAQNAIHKVEISKELSEGRKVLGDEFDWREFEEEMNYRDDIEREKKNATSREQWRSQSDQVEKEIATYLAGAKHYDTSQARTGPVELVPEPSNSHDPNAVKVIQDGRHIGYVPKEVAGSVQADCRARLDTVGYPWTLFIRHAKYRSIYEHGEPQ